MTITVATSTYLFLARYFSIASTHIEVKIRSFKEIFWTLLVIVKSKKPVKNTSEEAKFLVKLLAYSPEYTTKRWTSSVSEKLSNTLKILVSPKKQTPSFFGYHCTRTVIRISETGLTFNEYIFSLKKDALSAVQSGYLQVISFIQVNLL